MDNDNHLKEVEGKRVHDHFNNKKAAISAARCTMVPGPVIVGAGPTGLATAACLKEKGVPSLILERADCIASLWQLKTYDRLRLHLPKQFCQLPLMPFPSNKKAAISAARCTLVPGPVIVGAGPSGLATAACLKEKGVPSLILERADCIASLWQLKTYDRLRLHLPKQFCQLPLMPFPSNFPTYPTKQQFLTYLETYTNHFGLDPLFKTTVVNAEYDHLSRLWRIKTLQGLKQEETEYLCQWLIVATGENAEEVEPYIEGRDCFRGPIFHSSSYKTGELFRDKNVLVVGCGNSGMEVSLDLCNYNARPSLVVRDTVHVLPQEMIGRSTFGLSMCLLKWFPVRLVDQFLLLMSWLMLGDTSQFGLIRPKLGPLELKNVSGKTPVLDVGALAKIRSGNIKVCRAIKRLTHHAAEFIDGSIENYDAIILATGYRSNVQYWLKDPEMFSKKDGFPRMEFPNGWKGAHGLYAVGFDKRGLLGASNDARRIAEDIEHQWNSEAKKLMAFSRSLPLPPNQDLEFKSVVVN